jgi:molecular chaperone GrpE
MNPVQSRRVPVRHPFDEPPAAAVASVPGPRPVSRPEPGIPGAGHGAIAMDRGAGEPAEPVAPAGSNRATREAQLEAEIERLHKLVEEKDQHAREAAVQARLAGEELERAKERIRKDADRELEQKKRGVLLAFVEVLDDLDRALEAARHSQGAPAAEASVAPRRAAAETVNGAAAVVQGVDLVRKGFLARLAQFDVTPLPALGQRFDPGRHEALSMVPVSDPEQDGLVQGVVREAYRIGDEILRPAAVAVGRFSR